MRQRTTPEPDSPTPVGPTPWKVVAVRALPQYRLFVRFVDGTEGEVNAGAMILGPKAGVFERLRDQELFAQAFVEDGAVAWPGGLDLAPDAMYDEIRGAGRWIIER